MFSIIVVFLLCYIVAAVMEMFFHKTSGLFRLGIAVLKVGLFGIDAVLRFLHIITAKSRGGAIADYLGAIFVFVFLGGPVGLAGYALIPLIFRLYVDKQVAERTNSINAAVVVGQ